MSNQIEHWINNEATAPESGKYFESLNPLDDSLYIKAAHGNNSDIDKAISAATVAFQSYKKTVVKDREALLLKTADLLLAQADEFVDILIDETGSTISKARFEIQLSVDLIRAAAGMTRQLTGQTLPTSAPERVSMSFREPLGVIACITPFNVPLIKGVKSSANALATGNTVVLLPSEEAPKLSIRLAKLYQEAGFPAGCFNVVTGFGHEIGDTLTSHPAVKMVAFTGSTRVGKHIAKLCGQQMKRVTLELGGKSPLVILKDADMNKAVTGAINSMFTHQGQVCMASSRIFVEKPIFDEFVTKFSAAAQNLSMGDLRDASTLLGPIINERQRQRVKSHIYDAVEKGATVITGNQWQGHKCAATILTGVTTDMQVYADETFGPITSVYPVDSVEEALERANESVYGLSAAIYSNDINKALYFARHVHSGMAHINAPTIYDEPGAPFGGVGESGFGREGTQEDIEMMTEWRWITIQL